MTVDELVKVLRRIRSAVEGNDPDVYDPRETLRDIHRVADEAICNSGAELRAHEFGACADHRDPELCARCEAEEAANAKA